MSAQMAFGLARDGWVVPGLVRSYARDVRIDAGKLWRIRDDDDWRGGWKRARKAGFRIVKVCINICDACPEKIAA